LYHAVTAGEPNSWLRRPTDDGTRLAFEVIGAAFMMRFMAALVSGETMPTR
jgi:hypothetical protein